MGLLSCAGREMEITAVEDAPGDFRTGVAHDHALALRRALMGEITEFLFANLLDVTPDNLVIAWHVFSQEGCLLRRVDERRAAREPITPEWFAGIGIEYGVINDPNQALDELMARMRDALTQDAADVTPADTTTAAAALVDKTGDDGGVARERQPRPAGLAQDGHDRASTARLARAMIESTRQVAADMMRSARETSTLRDSLRRARREAELDYLTELPNRRAFDALYEREYREARAQVGLLSVAFCDIDNFKVINDTHGHSAGDRVIQAIAEQFKRISGDNCHVARHGGEEFVLLFRGLTVEHAADCLNDARIAFGERRLVNRDTDAPIGQVTFSGGVANVLAYATASAALKAADDALYDAKSGGRNCIRLART